MDCSRVCFGFTMPALFAAYARTQLPVDEDLVAQQIAEALPDSSESK